MIGGLKSMVDPAQGDGKYCLFSGMFSRRRWASGILVLGMVQGCGLPEHSAQVPNGGHSRLDTVDLPATPVDNQGRFGICWAYGTIGLIESNYKRLSGVDVNLSEEALAFYFLSEHIASIIRESVSFAEFFQQTSRGFNEGYFARITEAKKAPGQLDAFDLVQRYGVVPESAWNYKITTGEQRSDLMGELRRKSIRYLSGRDLAAVTVQEVMDNIMVGEGVFPSRPPDTFVFQGAMATAVDFSQRILGFKPTDYVAVEVQSEADLDPWIGAVKRALASGYTVPFGFPINVQRIKDNSFGSDGVSLDDPIAFVADGGHLVLVTDFVNLGGREGRVSDAELAAELSRPSSDLDHLRFKNSWGLGAKTDGDGRLVSSSPDGYYSLSRGYLVGAARAAAKGFLPLNAVVPLKVMESSEGRDGVR